MNELKSTVEYLKEMVGDEIKKNREDLIRDMSDPDYWNVSDGETFASRLRSQKLGEEVTERAFTGLMQLADQLERIERKLVIVEKKLDDITK